MEEKRLIEYNEIRRLFDAKYKETAQLIRDGETNLDNLAEGFTEADRIIQQLPVVDAVEVVRCKDCKYQTVMWCWREEEGRNPCRVGSDDFCSYGARKDGDGNG